MAIITFTSNEIKETGQTLSCAALASHIAIEHNCKVMLIATGYKESTLEDCFWEAEDRAALIEGIVQNRKAIGLGTGVEGLVRALASKKTGPEIIKSYSKTILRDRLDVLPSCKFKDYKDYEMISDKYSEIIQLANNYYDFVFIDVCSRMADQYKDKISQISDIIVLNLTQRMKCIDNFIKLKAKDDFYKRKNIMLLIGRYDAYSKYNTKNITRYMKERKPVNVIPYNTLFFEACSEAKIIDFFLKMKNIDETDRNYLFIKEVTRLNSDIIYRLQELQMQA